MKTCDYCLGKFPSNRPDARLCPPGGCRVAVHRARKLASYADVDRFSLRTGDGNNALGRQLDRHEAAAAMLRVRALAGLDPVETMAQWEAVDAHPDGRRRLRMTVEQWNALRVRLQALRDEVRAWLATQPDDYQPPQPMPVEYT